MKNNEEHSFDGMTPIDCFFMELVSALLFIKNYWNENIAVEAKTCVDVHSWKPKTVDK